MALCWVLPASPLGLAGLTGAAALGLLAVFTSVMIYADTRRAFWALPLTATRFYGATLLLGVTAAATVMSWMELFGAAHLASAFRISIIVSIAVRTLLFGWELWRAWQSLRDASNPCHRSEQTIRVLAAMVDACAPCTFPSRDLFFHRWRSPQVEPSQRSLMSLALVATFAAQLLERFSFFTAVTAPRMPGGI